MPQSPANSRQYMQSSGGSAAGRPQYMVTRSRYSTLVNGIIKYKRSL